MSIDNNSKNIHLNYIDFNLPIFYIQDKYHLNDNVKNDLEISNSYHSKSALIAIAWP